MAHQWIKMTPDSVIPPSAVIAEPDCNNGFPTYVGRASHEGGTFPARVDSKNNCAYISYGGSQIKKTDYEVLVGDNYKFVKYNPGTIPTSLVQAGNTANGEPLWVGRGIVEGNLIVGKIHPVHQCLFVSFDGQEHQLDPEEVLVSEAAQSSNTGILSNGGNCPQNQFVSGAGTWNSSSFSTEAVVEQGTFEDSKIDHGFAGQSVTGNDHGFAGQSVTGDDHGFAGQSVTGNDHGFAGQSVTGNYHSFSGQSVTGDDHGFTGQSDTGDTTNYTTTVTTEHYTVNNADEITPHSWVKTTFDNIPENAVVAGQNEDGSKTYVGRGDYKSDFLPTHVDPKKGLISLSFNGHAPISRGPLFDVLVGEGYSWVEGKQFGDNIPPGAVTPGVTPAGKEIYIGRGLCEGSMIVGKVFPKHYAVYVPYKDLEHEINNYEILIKEN